MPRKPPAEATYDNPEGAPPPSGVEFAVDNHGAPKLDGDDKKTPDPVPGVAQPEATVMPGALWTPEEAGQLVCAVFNLGILVYGPEWAAKPEETKGWNISLAQLLDVYMPRGAGGFVELGAGLFMVGNGLAMMTVNRVPIIKRGPRPLWVKPAPKVAAEGVPSPDAAPSAPPPNPPPAAGGGYRLPSDLAVVVPPSEPPLVGLGYQ